ncbi:MAG: carbohydrate ABC transporter permease [Candidatus Firestonebacteria bacterium]
MKKVIVYLVLGLGAIFMLLPFYWMVTTSFKLPSEILQLPPKWFPSTLNFKNYADALRTAPFALYFLNSFIIAIANTVLQVLTSAMAGYAFARLDFKFKDQLFLLFLGTMMIPMEVILIPNYLLLKYLGIYNTYFALVIPWAASVFGIFLMRQFVMSLPKELFESAQIDGCNHWQMLWQIVFPIAKPVFISVGLFSLIASWNSFLWPLIMTDSESMRTVPVGLAYFTTEYASRYHLMMAAAVLSTIPIVLTYFFAQKQFVEGIATSGING